MMRSGEQLRLTRGQQALWYLDHLMPGTSAYNIGGAGRASAAFDLEALDGAVRDLTARHPWVGARFESRDGEPVAIVDPAASPRLEIVESAASGAVLDPDAAIARAAEVVNRPYDLSTGPLLRVAVVAGKDAERPLLVLAAHHTIADFAALGVLLADLEAGYRARLEGARPTADPAADSASFESAPVVASEIATEIARRETARAESARGERAWRYWRRTLAERPTRLALPADPASGSELGPLGTRLRGDSVRRRLREDVVQRLRDFAADRDSSLFTVLASAFQALLHRWGGQPEVMLGTPATSRDKATRDVVAYMVNPLAVRADFADDPSFAAHLERQKRAWFGALRHRDLPHPMLVERLTAGTEGEAHAPLFQAMYVHYGARTGTERALLAFALGRGPTFDVGGWRLEPVSLPREGAQLDVFLASAEVDDGIEVELTYDIDRIDSATAGRMLSALERLLESAMADPERRVSRLSMLDPETRARLIAAGAPSPPPGAPATLDSRIFARAMANPDSVAIVDGDRQWTYGELSTFASRVANRLRAEGIGTEDLVGIAAPRCAEMIGGMLGVLAAGAAYVPLDLAYPAARLRLILDDCAARAALVVGARPSALEEATLPLIDLASHGATEAATPPAALAEGCLDRLAYVIYTSGSTGRPKGVAISHRNADTMVRWAATRFSDRQRQGVLAATSICFDLSVFEIFATLGLGGRVILAPDALGLRALPSANRVTLVNSVPSAAAALVAGGDLGPAVDTVCLAGEPLPADLVAALHETRPDLEVWNLYGPSEDTTYSTEAEIARGESAPPIGNAVAGSRVALVDAELEPVPRGVVGEIVLGGAKVTRGYLGRPALTAERYVPDPFADEPGRRIYRTGDLARWRGDGSLAFLGRMDNQVKIRGFRIELGEIEVALRGIEGVEDALVMARATEDGDQRLVAYLVGDEAAPSAGPGAESLRAALGGRLPEHMLPQHFERLDSMPLLPNGKIDRKMLAARPLDFGRDDLATDFVAPSTEVEEMLAAMWREVLGVERVGIYDSFFALGGHSLLAMRVLARVRDAFGIELPLRALLEQPTIAGMQQAIADQLLADADEETVAAVLAELDGTP